MECSVLDKNSLLIYRMTLVNMGKQNKQGYTGYTVLLGKHGYTGYIGVYRVHSITRVNMGTQDI